MAKEGTTGIIWAAYPHKTLPNQLTIATGLRPYKHGIIDEKFWDNNMKRYYDYSDPELRNDLSFYNGEPIWTYLEENNIKTGILYWAGCDIAFNNIYPSYYKTESDTENMLTAYEQVDTIISWLKLPQDKRPRFIMSYMKDIDNITGIYGPESKEAFQYAHKMDQLIGDLEAKINKLPYAKNINLIVLSNQGKINVSPDRTVDIFKYIKPNWIEKIEGTNPLYVFSKEQYRDSIVNNLYSKDHLYVFKNEEIPDDLLYRGNPARCGDILIATENTWQFAHVANKEIKGENGFFPVYMDMRTIFRAKGPDFRKNYDGRDFFNVDIYALFERLYKLEHKRVNARVKRVEDLFKGYEGDPFIE